MRKNMLTILILASTLANLVMTAVLMFVIVPSTKNTDTLVRKVATAIDLQVEEDESGELSIYDTETYVFTESEMTINLKRSKGSSQDNYAVISGISLILDKTKDDYSKASAKIASNEIDISDIITTVYEGYTKDEALANKEQIKEEIVKKICSKFETEIVVDIAFASIACQ